MYFMYVHFDINLGGNPSDRKANLAYTLVNILYYGIYGFIFLFLSPYMLDNGFNNSEIGMMMAAGFIVAVFLQQIIANFADNSKNVTVSEILAAGFLLIIAINVILLFLSGRNALICILYCAQIITIMSVQPCLNAMNFQLQNYQYKMNYGIARSTGSLSYAVISAIIGQVIGSFGNSLLQYGVIVLGTCLILLLAAMDLKLRKKEKLLREISETSGEADSENASGGTEEKVTYLQFIRRYSPFLIFVLGCTLLFYSYATLNNYLYQVMQPLGATSADYGNIQGFKAGVELFPMILSLTLVMKFGIRKLVVLSSFCFFVKSLLTLLAGSITQIWIATAFQMISYGLFAPIAVYYVAELFDKHDAVKGQSLITMAYAIGCVISSLAGGLILNSFGAKVLLTVSTTASLIGAVITVLSLSVIDRKIPRKNPMF